MQVLGLAATDTFLTGLVRDARGLMGATNHDISEAPSIELERATMDAIIRRGKIVNRGVLEVLQCRVPIVVLRECSK